MTVALSMDACTRRSYIIAQRFINAAKIMLCLRDMANMNEMSGRSHRACSVKKVFLKISQILQENICVGLSY